MSNNTQRYKHRLQVRNVTNETSKHSQVIKAQTRYARETLWRRVKEDRRLAATLIKPAKIAYAQCDIKTEGIVNLKLSVSTYDDNSQSKDLGPQKKWA